jgi:hypothetical protein
MSDEADMIAKALRRIDTALDTYDKIDERATDSLHVILAAALAGARRDLLDHQRLLS